MHHWGNFLMEDVVHDRTDFTKGSASIAQFPKHAVHRIQWPPHFPRSPQHRSKPTFNSTKLFWYSHHDVSTAHPSQRRVFLHNTNTCPPNRSSAGILIGQGMVFHASKSLHTITSKFSPGPYEKGEHRNGTEQSHGTSRLDTLREMTQVPRRHAAYGDRYPQGIPCCRIGGHNVAPSQLSLIHISEPTRPERSGGGGGGV